MVNLVYNMVRVLFLVLVEKGLIENNDIERMSKLMKDYESKEIDDKINQFKSKYRTDKIDKKIRKGMKEFKKIGNS